jgi:hypothetical protein
VKPETETGQRGIFGALALALLCLLGAERFAAALGHGFFEEPLDARDLPLVLGRPESCVACHAFVSGLGQGHDASAIGCASCHGGAPAAIGAARAHAGMIRVPGNLDTAAQTCGVCHAAQVARVQGSLMNTLRGMIAVDRQFFGEPGRPTEGHHVDALGDSPADTHLKQLCTGCHLGTPKLAPGPPGELSRGGGCAACHASYPATGRYTRRTSARFVHPAVSAQVRDESCFGCHSRSGRISLGYAGYWESGLSAAQAAALPPGETRTLADGRVLRRAPEDVHHARGMACIDCHTAQEVMGDGALHAHEEEATAVRCQTCHRTQPARSEARSELAAEAAALVRLRAGTSAPARLLLEDRTGEALVNAAPLEGGAVEITLKLTGAHLTARPPAAACAREQGHERVSCRACHEAWVTQCVGCHTQWDPSGTRREQPSGVERKGAWVEYDVAPRIGPPALGVVSREGREEIVPFTPGMILTLNGPEEGHRDGAGPARALPAEAAALVTPRTRFVRAFAPAVPHTTQKQARSCANCHLDPEALGYGRGKLSLAREGGEWRWRLDGDYQPSQQDGLPADAWIGFLSNTPGAATRAAARSFTLAEQERILAVGACLGCHDAASERGRDLYAHFRERRASISPECRVPSRLQR